MDVPYSNAKQFRNIAFTVFGVLVIGSFLIRLGVIDGSKPPYSHIDTAIVISWGLWIARDTCIVIHDAYKKGELFSPLTHRGSAVFVALLGSLAIFGLRFVIHGELPTEIPSGPLLGVAALWITLLVLNYEKQVRQLEQKVEALTDDTAENETLD